MSRSAPSRPALVPRAVLTALSSLFALAALSRPAAAEEMSFMIRNGHPNAMVLELYSQDREHDWPGNGQSWILDDDETKEVAITCRSGENICYGAWISGDEDGSFWGVGPDNKHRCSDCCYTCDGGETEDINLVP